MQVSSLQGKVVLVLIAAVFLVMGISGVVNYRTMYQSAYESLNLKGERISDRLGLALQSPMWDFNVSAGEGLIRAELADPDIIAIVVHDTQLEDIWLGMVIDREVGYLSTAGTAILADILHQYTDRAFMAVPGVIEHSDAELGTFEVYFTDQGIQAQLQYELVQLFTTTIIIGVLLAVTMVILLRALVVRPIGQLSSEMEEITKEMDFKRRVDIRRNDEVGQLGKAFNSMANELELSFAKIREYSEHLEEMVDKRTEELNEVNNELKDKNEIMEQELNIAQRVQRSLLPTERETDIGDELDFAASYSSMTAIGGDLFDVIRIGPSSYGFFIVDVSGHGVPAALITMMAKVSFTTYSGENISTAETCRRVNQELCNLIGDLEHYLTAYFCKINLKTGVFEFTNCGHLPALVVRTETGKIEELDTKGFLIGSIKEGTYESKSITLNEGDKTLLFTDGLVEARNEQGHFYGQERIYSFMNKHIDETPKEFVDGLVTDVDDFCGSQPADDDRAILYFEFVSKMSEFEYERIEDSIAVEGRSMPSQQEQDEDAAREIQEKYQKGLELMQTNNHMEALSVFKEVLNLDPNNLKVLNNIVVLQYKLGFYEEAYNAIKDIKAKGHASKTLDNNMQTIKQKLGID